MYRQPLSTCQHTNRMRNKEPYHPLIIRVYDYLLCAYFICNSINTSCSAFFCSDYEKVVKHKEQSQASDFGCIYSFVYMELSRLDNFIRQTCPYKLHKKKQAHRAR
ncbi:hypothetical protein SORBI_3002G183750 [Sorghum bicolor]|uniref:Uncharacterized protein n=1 Tax=Sorghum bicolor TaxID=4558 RepID=A0A1W0W4Z3_SORBI|nr:hypothetical protein SORBI_3002G183750 [Sorghum bicolor]